MALLQILNSQLVLESLVLPSPCHSLCSPQLPPIPRLSAFYKAARRAQSASYTSRGSHSPAAALLLDTFSWPLLDSAAALVSPSLTGLGRGRRL